MFGTLLIANRGEIACRVIRTARRLGIRTVAVYSEADARARHVREADVALPLGAAPARESYLDVEKILRAAARAGADALHPGYGFLSENADFAEACEKAGVRFVGPPAGAIRAMGLKDEAKRRMEAAGVPVVPGLHSGSDALAELAAAAERVGYPVLVKAVAGGGGRGMRRVDAPEGLEPAVAAARREAQAAFGHAGVLLEKWITRPRHVEVQVFADAHGNVVSLGERDCSLQRRHQKVLEEAPAPGLTPPLRRALADAAVRATRAIDYRGAGTIEFVLDASGPLDERSFYFMEMNTRLQVEHPVTEAITGQDLVEWQLRVAAGEPLPLAQHEIVPRGHAIEVRVYAEDPARGYRPQTGRLVRHRPPGEDEHVRVDAGFDEGDTISHWYDALIAKLIVHDEDRGRAIGRLRSALAGYAIAGVATNLAQLHAVAEWPAFAAGDVHTGFLDEHAPHLAPVPAAPPSEAVVLLAAAELHDRAERARRAAGSEPASPWSATDAFRLNADGFDTLSFRFGGETLSLAVHFTRHCVTLEWNGRGAIVRDVRRDGDVVSAEIDGARLRASVIEDGTSLYVVRGPSALRFERVLEDASLDETGGTGGALLAPLPGRITAVHVEDGARVRAGQPLVTLEAMKMEHTLVAGTAGTIESLAVAVGQQVEEGTALLVVAAS